MYMAMCHALERLVLAHSVPGQVNVYTERESVPGQVNGQRERVTCPGTLSARTSECIIHLARESCPGTLSLSGHALYIHLSWHSLSLWPCIIHSLVLAHSLSLAMHYTFTCPGTLSLSGHALYIHCSCHRLQSLLLPSASVSKHSSRR